MSKIKQPLSPRSQENELAGFLEFMVEQISTRFNSQVLGKLQKRTVDQFADAQTGNYASVLLQLSKQLERKINKQFDDKRIQQMMANILRKTDSRQKKQLYGAVEKAIGISTKQLITNEGLAPMINALTLESAVWAQKLRDETLERMINDTLHGMATGMSLAELVDQFKDVEENRKGHARFLAHNTIQNYNALSGKLRAEKLGVTRGIWRTAHDESVRLSHKDRDGKEYDLKEGLYSALDKKHLIAGIDYGCRCYTEYILDDE